MFLQLKGVFAEYEKHKTRERTSRGRREKIQQKLVPSGRSAFGYRYRGKRENSRGEWVIIPEQADVVKRIFRMADEGISPLEIARKLDADGVPTATGARWNKWVVCTILRNSAYYGEAHFNRLASCEPRRRRRAPAPGQSKKTSQRRRDKSEWIEVPVPAIIDKALFDRVRAIIERGAKAHVGRPARAATLFSGAGLLKCGICKQAMYWYPNKGRGYYRCGNFNRLTRERKCPGARAWVRDLEAAVWKNAVEMLSDADALRREVAAHDRARIQAQKNGAKRRAQLEREIFKLRQREARAARDMCDAELESAHSVFRADLKATEAKRREAERELRALTPQDFTNGTGGEDLERACQEFAQAAKDATPEQKRKIITDSVKAIRVWGDGEGFEFEMVLHRPWAMLPERKSSLVADLRSSYDGGGGINRECHFRDVGAGDQQNQAECAHDDPQRRSDIAHGVLLKRQDLGSEVSIFEQDLAESGRRRPRVQPYGEHTRDVGVGLLQSDAWLQSRDALEAELPQEYFRPFKALRQDQLLIQIPEAKTGRHHSDYGARPRIDSDGLADDGAVSAELGLPVAVAQHHGFGCSGRVVGLRKPAAEHGFDVQRV
jgi:site-specific DNA recombinase